MCAWWWRTCSTARGLWVHQVASSASPPATGSPSAETRPASTTTCNLTKNCTTCNLRNNWRLALANTTCNLTNNCTMCNIRNNWRLSLANTTTCKSKKQLGTCPGKQNNMQSNNQSFSPTKWSGVGYSINCDSSRSMNKLISQKNNCLKMG